MNQQEGGSIQEININIPKICVVVFGLYIVLVVAFYFLAGEQLHLRQSRGEWTMPVAEAGTVELVQDATVEQVFKVNIQRLQSVSVQCGTYYRSNAGIVTMELWNINSGTCLLTEQYDATTIEEGGLLTLTAKEPLEGLYGIPLMLRIYANSQLGSAVSPLMSASVQKDDFSLYLNGIEVMGLLCFSVSGQDYIWTGLHYWKFSVGFGLLLALMLFYVYHQWKTGRHSYIVYALVAMKKYRFLIRQLVARDFKTKYKRSVLGIFWSFLNPLFTMSVQYFIFSTIFKSDISNYAVYLLIGIVSFNFFNESCGMALVSIISNAGLITKVYMPKYIYPLTRIMSSVVNLGISLLPLLIVTLVTGVKLQKSAVLAFYFLVCLIIFSLGVGLLLSAAMVFFRDTQFLWGIFSMMWMYATPIFYPENILPDQFRFILQMNPLYHFLKNIRLCILEGISPEPIIYMQCILIAFGVLLIGTLVFQKTQDQFVLYL
ncbi:MAG: ABC transporter permease [Anaerotruncus sp.]|nr:ABC transporter permease [Anaerotruncus sp.]